MSHPIHKPRKRTYLACTYCRSRKQRCDAKQPRCSNCTQQDAQCIYQAASQRSLVTPQYVQSLLNQIEDLQRQFGPAATSPPLADLADVTPPGRARDGFTLPATAGDDGVSPQASLARRGTTQSPVDVKTAVVEFSSQPRAEDPRAASLVPAASQASLSPLDSANATTASVRPPFSRDDAPSGPNAVLPAESGVRLTVPEPTFDFDLHNLPQRWLANHLVECYMDMCQPQYPFLHEATFRQRYDQIWTSTDPAPRVLAGTINAVFALGCHYSPGTSTAAGDAYFRRAKALILSDPSLEADNAVTNSLQGLALLAMYPHSQESQEDTWDIIGLMIRLSPKLHILNCPEPRSYEDEVRKEMKIRLWWACYILDAVYSSYFGRDPRFVTPTDQIPLPKALEDEESHTSADLGSNLTRPPPRIAFFVQTIRLYQLMRSVTLRFRSAPSLTQTLDIDQQILQWFSTVPHMAIAEQQCRPPSLLWRQREVLTARFLNLRVRLLARHVRATPPRIDRISAFTSVKDVADRAMQPVLEEACVKAAVELLDRLARLYSVENGPHSAWWYDLQKIRGSSEALLFHLARQMDGAPSTAPLADLGQERALHEALALLQQIEDRGKPQAADLRRHVEKEILKLREKAGRVGADSSLFREDQPPEATTAQSTLAPEVQPDISFDILGQGMMDVGVGVGIGMGAVGGVSWEPEWDVLEPFWPDLLH